MHNGHLAAIFILAVVAAFFVVVYLIERRSCDVKSGYIRQLEWEVDVLRREIRDETQTKLSTFGELVCSFKIDPKNGRLIVRPYKKRAPGAEFCYSGPKAYISFNNSESATLHSSNNRVFIARCQIDQSRNTLLITLETSEINCSLLGNTGKPANPGAGKGKESPDNGTDKCTKKMLTNP